MEPLCLPRAGKVLRGNAWVVSALEAVPLSALAADPHTEVSLAVTTPRPAPSGGRLTGSGRMRAAQLRCTAAVRPFDHTGLMTVLE